MEVRVKQLPRSTPEEQGISSSAIVRFLEGIERSGLELHSMMIVRHGHVVAEGWWEPYRADRPHMLFSLSKSFASTAIGFAVQEGLLSVEDHVVSFFPEYADVYESNANLLSMRVKHLLSMATGHAEDTTGRVTGSEDWVKSFLSLPVEHEPGSLFVYNSGASYMLSAIIQRVTGQTLLQYIKPRLFEPLSIEDATWDTCPKGINTGGWGLNLRTEDIAKFGQLYVQNGLWNGERILSEEWVRQATSLQVKNGDEAASDWQQGYGYQFWRCRHGAYRGDGAFGQYCIVMPKQEAVIAITSGLENMQAVLDLVWERLLPAMAETRLPADDPGVQSLRKKLESLAIVPPKHGWSSPVGEAVSGKFYTLKNEERKLGLKLEFHEDCTDITIRDEQGESSFSCGKGVWVEGIARINGPEKPICASGMWLDENKFSVTIRFVETPFCETYHFAFHENTLRVESSINVSFGPKQRPVLEGLLAE